MKFKPQPWQLILLIAAVCGVSVGGMVWYHSTTLTRSALLKRIPSNDALVIWIDFAELRRGGFLQLLGGAKAAEEAEYQSFVYATRFDYMNDLDSVLISFPQAGGAYAFVEGRFDWKNLRAYVARENGKCINSLCRLVGSAPDRHISFLPLRRDLMAMAVSAGDAYAVNDISSPRSGPNPPVPEGLVWIRFPGALPKTWQNLPDGARSLTRIIERAPSVLISFVTEKDQLVAKLEIDCRAPQEASDLASELSATTELARTAIAREHQTPNPADFSGFLTSGVFQTQGTRVLGHWPISKALIRSLLETQ